MDLDKYISLLKDGKCLVEKDVYMICEKVKEILIEESNVQSVSAPVTICGNIHGQFYDVLELFRIGGDIPDMSYIFMGGIIDKGWMSVETLTLLLCLKLKYPTHVTLLRGHHECRYFSQMYGLYGEIEHKYGNTNPWKYFTDVFDYFAVGAIVEGSILCVHGGLSPDIKTLDQIRTIDRIVETPHKGALCDLIWSDPGDIDRWEENPRGAGWLFGSRVTKEFNYINKLDLIARSHQLVPEGYKYWFPKQNLVNIWSSPNFANICGNLGAMLYVDENLEREVKIFNSVPKTSQIINPVNLYPNFN